MTADQLNSEKLSIRPLIREVAQRAGVPMTTARAVYDALEGVLIENLSRGICVELTGFGSFTPHTHRGHPVRFGRGAIEDYRVVRFHAGARLKHRLRE